jgi:hypothetical protein
MSTTSKKAIVILLMLALSLAAGMFAEAASETHPRKSMFGLNIGIGFLAFLWCTFDSEQYKYRFGRALSIAIVLFLPIGFPIYCFKSRGMKAAITLPLALILALFLALLFRIGQYIVLALGMA